MAVCRSQCGFIPLVFVHGALRPTVFKGMRRVFFINLLFLIHYLYGTAIIASGRSLCFLKGLVLVCHTLFWCWTLWPTNYEFCETEKHFVVGSSEQLEDDIHDEWFVEAFGGF